MLSKKGHGSKKADEEVAAKLTAVAARENISEVIDLLQTPFFDNPIVILLVG